MLALNQVSSNDMKSMIRIFLSNLGPLIMGFGSQLFKIAIGPVASAIQTCDKFKPGPH